jgi:hypothetical protein
MVSLVSFGQRAKWIGKNDFEETETNHHGRSLPGLRRNRQGRAPPSKIRHEAFSAGLP